MAQVTEAGNLNQFDKELSGRSKLRRCWTDKKRRSSTRT